MTTFDDLSQRIDDLESRQLGLDDLPIAQLQRRLEQQWLSDAVEAVVPAVPFGTLLPPASDGDVIDLAPDTAAGVVWRFRYRAGSASTYKWEFIGGSSLAVEDSASVTVGAGAVYAAIAANALTLPYGGDYVIEYGGRFQNAGTGVAEAASLTVKLGAAAAADAEAITFNHPGSANSWSVSLARKLRRNSLASGAVLQLYRKGVNNADTIDNRFLFVTPARIG